MKVRWGIVGTGKICNDFVNAFNSYAALHKLPDQEIVAVAARNRTNAETFAKTHNINMVFDSYYEMACSKDIDVVYIGTINPTHYEFTKMYLENQKHVLCEKPLCMTKTQVYDLIILARTNKRFLMEGVWSRFSPAYEKLQQEIEAGKIGEVKFLEANLGIDSDSERILQKQYGGSAVLYVGIYVLQLAQLIFKESPDKITTVGSLNEHGVDTTETIILQYKGGKRAVLNTNTQLKLCNEATVYGTNGYIKLQEPFFFPTSMIIKAPSSSDEEVHAVFELHQSKLPYNFENSAGLVYEAMEVSNCIRQGLLESSRMTLKESLVLAYLEQDIRKTLQVHFECDDDESCPII